MLKPKFRKISTTRRLRNVAPISRALKHHNKKSGTDLVREGLTFLPVLYGVAFVISIFIDIAVFEEWGLDFLQLAGIADIFLTSFQLFSSFFSALLGYAIGEALIQMRPPESMVPGVWNRVARAALAGAVATVCFWALRMVAPTGAASIPYLAAVFLFSVILVCGTESAGLALSAVEHGADALHRRLFGDQSLQAHRERRRERIFTPERMYKAMRIGYGAFIGLFLVWYQYDAVANYGFLNARALRANVPMCTGAKLLWRGSSSAVFSCEDSRKVVLSNPENLWLYAAEPNRLSSACRSLKNRFVDRFACFR